MTKQVSGYDKGIETDEDWEEFHAEARRRGHHYSLFVEGMEDKDPEKQKVGQVFAAETLEKAKQFAYRHACELSDVLDYPDRHDHSEIDAYFSGRDAVTGGELFEAIIAGKAKIHTRTDLPAPLHYPTHAYKLYNQRGELVVDYTPPDLEDVVSGKTDNA